MIDFKNVHKSFGAKKILNGLTFSVAKGEAFFILGRSGTGKSVALKHLVGLLRADSGEIVLDGQRIENSSEEEFIAIRKKCGIVFQLPALVDSRTVFENLCLGIRKKSIKIRSVEAAKALFDVDLEKLIPQMGNRFPPELSYGEQKRVSLARTLLIQPDYVLYDEPTTGLDPHTSKNIHDLIKYVAKKIGKTSIVVSHDMENALKTADRIGVLDAGIMVDLGTPEEIRRSKVPMTASFLEDIV